MSLDGWTEAQRDGLAFLIEDAGRSVTWSPGSIRVPDDSAAQVRVFMGFLSEIPDGVVPELVATAHFERPRPSDALPVPHFDDLPIPDVARPHLRIGGSLIDALITAPVTVGLALTGIGIDARWWISTIFVAVYLIGMLASLGRTVGNMAAHTRVVMLGDRSRPGLRAASIRWFVPLAFSFPVMILGWPSWIDLPWSLAVYVPVFFRPSYRGLHDRASGVMVVDDHRARFRTPPPSPDWPPPLSD